MSIPVLTILKFAFIAIVWLFFLRVARAVYVEVRRAPAASSSIRAAAPRSPVPVAQAGASANQKSLARLVILEPTGSKGVVFVLDRPELRIGRAADCEICLAGDRFASQHHARLYMKAGKYCVEDVGSTNGTLLNSRPLDGVAPLNPGDRLQVGQTVLEVTA
jgi:pSer/pThr/pTyr-binding forkhead associated (FHA) protein